MKINKALSLVNKNIQDLEHGDFYKSNKESCLLNVYEEQKNKVLGFGGALTYSSAYNYSLLNNDEKKEFLEKLVGESGLHYSIFRLCIGSSDFAIKEYCYVKDNDFSLSSFSIEEDLKYIIPLIKDIKKYAKQSLSFIASSWSPPAFMKTIATRQHGGKLKKEYYGLYADYIIKFLLAYQKEGINIQSLTIQNEPKATQSWESCVFTIEEEIALAKILKTKIKKVNLKVDLYCWDHNKERLVEKANKAFKTNLFKGIAFHWYSGNHFEAIQTVRNKYPNKNIIETEFCHSTGFDETTSSYAYEIINNLKNGANAIIEWNVLLNNDGGPYHDRGSQKVCGCIAPLMLDINNNLVESKTYKQTFLFSNFIKENAKTLYTSTYDENIIVAAFKNPDGTYIINIQNTLEKDVSCTVYIHNQFVDLKLKAKSINTIEIVK